MKYFTTIAQCTCLGLGLELWSIVGKPIKDVKYVMMVTKFGRIPERQQWIVGLFCNGLR